MNPCSPGGTVILVKDRVANTAVARLEITSFGFVSSFDVRDVLGGDEGPSVGRRRSAVSAMIIPRGQARHWSVSDRLEPGSVGEGGHDGEKWIETCPGIDTA